MQIKEIIQQTYTLLPQEHRIKIFWLTLLMLVVGIAELGLAAMISLLGVSLAAPESLQNLPVIGAYFASFPAFGNVPAVIAMLTVVLAFVALATIVKNILTALMIYQQVHVSQTISWDVGLHIFNNYLYAPYIWYSQQNTAVLQGHLGWRSYIATIWIGILNVITQGVVVVFLVVGAFIAAPWASLLLFGICGSTSFLIYKLSRKKVSELSVQAADINVRLGKVAHFALQGMREVHIYNQRQSFYDQYASYAKPSIDILSKQGLYPPLPVWVLESIGFILLLATVILLQWQGESVASITGTLTLLAGISWRLLPAMNRFLGSTLQLKASVGPAGNFLTLYLNLPKGGNAAKTNTLKNVLQLNHVNFTYPQSQKPALSNISLSIEKGSMVGLVGLSGAGKSTLVRILTGLLPPDDGEFLVDGVAINPAPSFLSIGYVPQSPYIMDATLAENVAFSDWGKGLDEARVLECCSLASMSFLDELPDGIHTILGDRGVRLSGGQIQRVAIARALYTNSEILLFDEATSALDGAAESAIQKTILSLRENMTIVLIAHRLSTVEGCDKIYWLHEGKIMQGGSQETLKNYEDFLNKLEK